MRQFSLSPALRLRLLGLIRRGQAGNVHSEPEAMAVLFHLAAVVLDPASDAGEDAVELAAWYDAEVEGETVDYGDGDGDSVEDFEDVDADVDVPA